MKDIEEKVICASIWYKEIELKKPEILEKRGYRPYNCDKGMVVSGWRHHNCIYQLVALTGLPDCDFGESVEGFLTNKNRFVDRKEAAQIALKTGQIDELEFSSTKLYSEDLY
jgi:hypothetical protein